MCVCVCVCERERERERESITAHVWRSEENLESDLLFHSMGPEFELRTLGLGSGTFPHQAILLALQMSFENFSHKLLTFVFC